MMAGGIRLPVEKRGQGGQSVSSSISLPAPIGGLNSKQSVANMGEEFALVLENWFPTPNDVQIRYGYDSFATFTGLCETIITYNGVTSTKVFVAVNTTNDAIIDATAGGAISTPVVGGSGPTVQAITSCQFDYVNFGTSGGQFLSLVNGADAPLQYDGTNWIASTMTGGTPANLFTVGVYSSRLWYAQKNSRSVWYQVTGGITGALTEINLGPLFKEGGTINSIITITDASNTLADYIGFLTTEGEIVAYTGDPAGATWAKVAHFKIGRPVTRGNRCWTKWGSDAVVVCADGVFPIRQAIEQNSRSNSLALSDNIRSLLNNDLRVYGGLANWGITLHPSGSKLIVNVPLVLSSESRQWVMNTDHGAWCKFTGWDAFCFAVTRDTLYWGGDGVLAKADDVTYLDDDGSAIVADAKQAFNYFGTRGRTKLIKMARPILAIDGSISVALDIDVDYEDTPPTQFNAIGGMSGDPWGGTWDVTWGGAAVVHREWYSVLGEGHAIAFRFRAQSDGVACAWSATDFIYQVGGMLG